MGLGVVPVGLGVPGVGLGVVPVGLGVEPVGLGVPGVGLGVVPVGLGVPGVVKDGQFRPLISVEFSSNRHALNSTFFRLTVARLTTTEEDLRQSCVTRPSLWPLVRFNGQGLAKITSTETGGY